MPKGTPEERAAKAAYMREWRLRPENHERVKAQQRAKYERNREDPEWVAKERARASEGYRRRGGWRNTYNAKNPEKASEYRRRWDAENRDKRSAAFRRWYERNRITKAARLAAYQSARRARLANAGVFVVTDKDLRRLLGNGCGYCGGIATEIDHLLPIARGGRHSVGNLIGACRSCNASKNHRTVMEWRVGKRVSRAA